MYVLLSLFLISYVNRVLFLVDQPYLKLLGDRYSFVIFQRKLKFDLAKNQNFTCCSSPGGIQRGAILRGAIPLEFTDAYCYNLSLSLSFIKPNTDISHYPHKRK